MRSRDHIRRDQTPSRAVRVFATRSSRGASERLYLVRGRRNAGVVKMYSGESRGSVSLSGFLFARSSWLSGLARIFDIGGTFDDYNFLSTPAQTDWFALASDAEMVRRDFWVAVQTFADKNISAFPKGKGEDCGSTGNELPEARERVHSMTLEQRREELEDRLRAYYEKKKMAAECRQRVFQERYLIGAQRNQLRAEEVEKTLA